MKRLFAAMMCALIFLLSFCASADSIRAGLTIDAEFTVIANPNNAVAAKVALEYDSSCLEWLSSNDFTSPNKTAVCLDLDGIRPGAKLKASFLILTPKSTSIRLSVLSAVDINENPVDGLVFASHSLGIGSSVPGFSLNAAEIESAAREVITSVRTWNAVSDVPYQYFSSFPLYPNFDFTKEESYKTALNASTNHFSIAYSAESNVRHYTAYHILPAVCNLKYEMSPDGNASVHVIHYQLNDSYIRMKASSDSDVIVVVIHNGQMSRRLYYSADDLRLIYLS